MSLRSFCISEASCLRASGGADGFVIFFEDLGEINGGNFLLGGNAGAGRRADRAQAKGGRCDRHHLKYFFHKQLKVVRVTDTNLDAATAAEVRIMLDRDAIVQPQRSASANGQNNAQAHAHVVGD